MTKHQPDERERWGSEHGCPICTARAAKLGTRLIERDRKRKLRRRFLCFDVIHLRCDRD